MKQSKDYRPELLTLSESQDLVASDDLYNKVTASYAYWNSMLARAQIKRASFFKEQNKPNDAGKYPSIASIDKQWDVTDEGNTMLFLKAEVENLKAIAKAVDNHNFTLRSEAKLAH